MTWKEDIHLKFSYTVDSIQKECNECISSAQAVIDEISSLSLDDVTFENTALALAKLDVAIDGRVSNLEFLQNVSVDKSIRDASMEADKLLSAFFVKASMNIEIYSRIKNFRVAKVDTYEQLDDESKRLVDRFIRDYERKGLDKSEEERKEIERLLTKISELGIEFSNILGEENTTLKFTRSQLDGMADDFIDGLEKVNDNGQEMFVLSLKYPHVGPISEMCKVSETRKKMEFHFNSRCMNTNPKIMEELVELRASVAKKLGYSSHADYVLQVRMAKSADNVAKFLQSMNTKLQPLADKELNEFLHYKKKECAETGEVYDGKINMWDFRYYLRKREEDMFQVDHEIIKEYFPLPLVTERLLDIYQELLHLTFEKIEDSETWHEDVVLYKVLDALEADKGKVVGYFYLDLYPREGKYAHAACFTLQTSCIADLTNWNSPNAERQIPVAGLVCNFTKPKPDNPKSALLPHKEVVTFFHEFGHVMHVLCSEAKYVKFSGTRVERDFVEAPSQMLENWCWETESILRLSGHYLDTSKKMPSELALKLAESKESTPGLLNKRQLLFGIFDQAIHTSDKADTQKLLEKFHTEVFGIPMTPDTNFAGSFGHLAGGYDAQYYGYMFSEVYSIDMFMTKFQKSLFDEKVGLEYRMSILRPGGTRDAIESIREFLGREPNQIAFLKSKGLDA